MPMCETQCGLSTLPANIRRWPNAGPMLAHVIKPALVQGLVFAGLRSIAAFLNSAYCWPWLQADTDPMSVKCWPVFIQPYSVLHARCTKAESMLARRLWRWHTFSVAPNMTRQPNTGLMLAQRPRRWANISPALGQCLMFAGAAWDCTIETAWQSQADRTPQKRRIHWADRVKPSSVYRWET